MKLDPYRKQRRIQFHARLYVRTVAEHTMRVDRQPHFLEIKEELNGEGSICASETGSVRDGPS